MPRASSSSSAGCMRSRSDSEPTTTPTSGLDMGDGCSDVSPVLGPRERDQLHGRVGRLPGIGDRITHAGDVEDPPAVRHEVVAVPHGGRILDVTGVGDSVSDAREAAYAAVQLISFAGAQYRTDIAAAVAHV